MQQDKQNTNKLLWAFKKAITLDSPMILMGAMASAWIVGVGVGGILLGASAPIALACFAVGAVLGAGAVIGLDMRELLKLEKEGVMKLHTPN